MARGEQHGVLVLGALAYLLAERELEVVVLRRPEALDRLQSVVSQCSRHVLGAHQVIAVLALLEAQPHAAGRTPEELLDELGHQPPLL